MKILIARSLDALLLCALYFGAYKGNVYLQNLVMPMTWLLIVLATIIGLSLTSERMKKSFKNGRKPKSYLSKLYSYTYDIVVFIALCILCYQVTGVFWALALLICQLAINKADKEIEQEKNTTA